MQGSDAELEEAAVTAHRGPCVLLAQQPRRAFHQTTNLSDKDSSELWNSSQMECRPFKDPTYDLRRLELDMAVQAVPVTQDLAIQATPARVCLLIACVHQACAAASMATVIPVACAVCHPLQPSRVLFCTSLPSVY